MKVRYGFVSNSSSSSFVIKLKESHACSTCNRANPDIIKLIENSCFSNTNYFNKDCMLEETKNELDILRNNLSRYSMEDPNHILPHLIEYNQTAGDMVKYYKKEIEEMEEFYEKIRNINDLYKIKIDYCDDYIKEVLEFGVNEGSIELIEGEL